MCYVKYYEKCFITEVGYSFSCNIESFFFFLVCIKKLQKNKFNLKWMCDTEVLFIMMACLLPSWQLVLNLPVLKKKVGLNIDSHFS